MFAGIPVRMSPFVIQIQSKMMIRIHDTRRIEKLTAKLSEKSVFVSVTTFIHIITDISDMKFSRNIVEIIMLTRQV